MSMLADIGKNLDILEKLVTEVEEEMNNLYFPPRTDLPAHINEHYDTLRAEAAQKFLNYLEDKRDKYKSFYINTLSFAEKGDI